MKKIWFVVLLLMSSMAMSSKDYVVFMVRGNVTITINGVEECVTEKMFIKDTWNVHVDNNSTLILKDEKKKRLPNINGDKKGVLKKLIKNNEVSFLDALSDVWEYIKGRTASDFGITVDDNKKIYFRGSTSRGDADSDSLSFQDKIIKDIIEQAIQNE